MPDLSTTLPTRPARANVVPQTPAAPSNSAAPGSGFLGQLNQSLAGQSTGSANTSVGIETTGPDVQTPKSPAITITPAIAAPLATSPSKPATFAQTPIVDPKATGRDRATALAAPQASSDPASNPTTPSPPTPAAQPLASIATPTPVAPPATDIGKTTPQSPAADTALPADQPALAANAAPLPTAITAAAATDATANVGRARSKSGSPAQPSDAAALSASNKAQTDSPVPLPAVSTLVIATATSKQPAAPLAQTLPATTDPTPAGNSPTSRVVAGSATPELRRTKLTATEATVTSPTPLAPTDAAPAPATATATPPSTTMPAPHLATSTLLQAATPAGSQIAQPTAPPPPAVQIAQALADPVRVMLAAPSQATGGPQVTTIQLDPIELGRVEIRIERSGDGSAKVELAAERPETLLRLVHDQPQLQQALDQAGIPPQGRTITFSLASDNGTTGSSFTNFAGDGNGGGNGQRSQQGYGNPQGTGTDTTETLVSTPVWSKTGLDITA